MRTCKECGYKWPTAEIALVQKWNGGKYCYCQVHRARESKVIKTISISQAKRGKTHSKALFKICSWGGFYRRRQCQALVSPGKICGVRWTTAEVSPDGLVIDDIRKCPRCASFKSKIENRRKRVNG